MAAVRVIGCGNLGAGDDAVGLIVARRVRERLGGKADVVEAGTAFRVVDLVRASRAAVVVDAVRTAGGGRRPGAVVRAEPGPDGLLAEIRGSLSSHGLGLAEALGLAAALGPVPKVVFLGVEAGDVTAGHPLSPPVEAAVDELVERVVAEAARLSREVDA
ncbi:MAG: hydrogenase maturation protease [Actinobacteria bacterium]|nr:hydrogenase maturation protease [Actinomycetota bacterium]